MILSAFEAPNRICQDNLCGHNSPSCSVSRFSFLLSPAKSNQPNVYSLPTYLILLRITRYIIIQTNEMKTERKNNSYNTFPSSIALINLENSRVQVYFFYWHFATHSLYLLCTRIPSFIWYNNIRSNIYFNVVMVIFVIIVKFSRYLIVFSIIWLTKNRLVELLARWNSSNVYRVTNGGGEGREGDYQAQKLERASCSWFGWFFELVREHRAENYLFSAWPNCLPLFQVIIYTPWPTVNYTANYFRAPVDLITGFVIVEFLDRN